MPRVETLRTCARRFSMLIISMRRCRCFTVPKRETFYYNVSQISCGTALAGLAKIAGPKDNRLFHDSRSSGFEMILVRILDNVVAQTGLAALEIRVISLIH